MKTIAGPLQVSACSRSMSRRASPSGLRRLWVGWLAWLPLAAAAAECSEARPERFPDFFARFAVTSDFALGRTVLPLQVARWSEDPELDDTIETTDFWVGRDDVARRPSLDAQRQASGLGTSIRALSATTAVVELRDPRHGVVQSLRFRLEAGCWMLWKVDEFGGE